MYCIVQKYPPPLLPPWTCPDMRYIWRKAKETPSHGALAHGCYADKKGAENHKCFVGKVEVFPIGQKTSNQSEGVLLTLGGMDSPCRIIVSSGRAAS